MEDKKIFFEWHSILKDLVKNIWVVILAVLIGIMGLFIAERSVYSPEYTSTATIVVNAKGASTSSMYGVSTEMAEIFSKVFVDPAMKTKTIEYLGVESFDGTISSTVLTDTNFVELKVTADSPQTAYELLSAILKVYPEMSKSIFENAVIDVIKYPSMPKAPSNALSSDNRKIVMAICLAVSVACIGAISVLRDTVKNESVFIAKIESKLLGSVPHESKKTRLKNGKRHKEKGLFMDSNAFISLRFAESFMKIASKMEYMHDRNGDKVFVISSVAENEGKSTTASNIAIALANKGNKVILVDLDGKKPALHKLFGAKYIEKAELGKLLNGEIRKSEFRLRRYKKTNLSLAINTKPYKDTHLWIESGVAKDVINVLKEQVDYVIIDTAPISVDSTVTDVVKFADKAIFVVRTDVAKVSAINDALLTITEVGGNLAGCILNDVYPDFAFFGLSGNEETGGHYYSKKNSYYYRYGKYAATNDAAEPIELDD